MLIGLIPGPKEPRRDINPFLVPLIKELLSLLYGVESYIESLSKSVLVRCALLCVACNIPASRKVCGFLGHSATLGCSKCLKHFLERLDIKTTLDSIEVSGRSVL